MWTAIVARNAQVSANRVGQNVPIGVQVNAGPALCKYSKKKQRPAHITDITWVAFALEALAVLPYVISCCTFRRNKDDGQWK
jgi:hypothetical protein